MPITIDRSNADDRHAILKLMDASRGEHLNDEARARQGFVQGRMDEALLARFQAELGVFVIRDGPVLAGFAMASRAIAAGNELAAETAEIAVQATGVSLDRIYLHGPVAIDRRYQGQGLLTRLLRRVCGELRDQFEVGTLFVEYANHRSLAIHRHYPMDEVAGFESNHRRYAIFTFSPADIVDYHR